MAKTQPNILQPLLTSDPKLAGQMMRLMVSGKAKSQKQAKEKAQLAVAVEAGHVQTLESLLNDGASPTDPVFDDSLLTRSIRRGQIAALRLLLAHGANPNPRKGSPPLGQAILQQNVEAAQMLIEAGAKVNVPAPGDQPELLSACLTGIQEMVELLLSHGAKTHLSGTVYVTQKHEVRKVTPLMAAAWLGNLEIVKCLLAAGADVQARDSENCTALDWAARGPAKKIGRQIAELLKRT